MPRCVSRRRNAEQIVRNGKRVFPCDDLFDPEPRGTVGLVHHTRAPEMGGKLGVVRNIVPMREEHRADTTQLLELLDQRTSEPRRVDEHVSTLARITHDQV